MSKQANTEKIQALLASLARWRVALFALLLVVLYGFLLLRIDSLHNVAVPPASSQTAAVPHIDPQAVQKIQQLQDNSVNVQALFDQARQNPFQE